ncbi:uncharacterized protein LOC100679671 isoform X2 [Nasonia vitripennis]|uniref:Uncharacterized protein n=1 Tax=Nasonia vitripennis TaxID=7425 RepID=A0A7M7LRP8_NASVI|nr:uncharacterized protein LOC100679671 isoform X2 [Nasonia vitripennis]
MKGFLILSALVTVVTARFSVLQLSPLSDLQAHASASATASSSSQQVSLLRLLPNARVASDGQVLDTLEQHEEAQQRARDNENVRSGLGLSPQVVSASALSSASSTVPLAADGRVLDTLEVRLAKAAHAAAHRNEQLRLASQNAQAAQAQAQQQQQNAESLLSSTSLAQSLASVNPTGAFTSSRVQLLQESPELSVVRAQQQQRQVVASHRQNILLTPQSNGLPILIGPDGQLVASPLLVL